MSAATSQPQAPEWTPGEMIARFVALRDKIKEIEDTHAKQLKPYYEMRAWLEGLLLVALARDNAESIRAEAGTAFKVVKTSVTVKRWSDTLDWIRDHEAWELLEARVSKTATLAMIEDLVAKAQAKAQELGQAVDPASVTIPGVVITQEQGLSVRRA